VLDAVLQKNHGFLKGTQGLGSAPVATRVSFQNRCKLIAGLKQCKPGLAAAGKKLWFGWVRNGSERFG
jgi:hypothetical protein